MEESILVVVFFINLFGILPLFESQCGDRQEKREREGRDVRHMVPAAVMYFICIRI